MGTMPLLWGVTVASEGAPLLFADLELYRRWHGTAGAFEPGFYLGAWGRVADDLPGELTGHHYYGERDAGLADLERLVAALLERAPGASVGSSRKPIDGWLEGVRGGDRADTVLRDDDGPLLKLCFHAATDYDRVVMGRDLGQDCGVVGFAGGRLGLMETYGGCVAEIGHTRGGVNELVAAVIECDPKQRRGLRSDLSERAVSESELGTIDVGSGVLVIADAAFAPADLVSDEAVDRAVDVLEAASHLRGPIRLSSGAIVGVATILRVDPGSYAVAAADDDRARWVRLRRE